MRRVCLALLWVAAPVAAGDDVPLDIGVTLLLKVLTYDAGFEGRGSGDFVVLVPHGDDSALKTLEKLGQLKLKARPLVFVAVKPAELAAQLETRKAAAVLLLPGASEALLTEVERLGTETRVYTFGLGEEAVKKHVMLGVTNNGGKPQLVINVARARASGADFPQSILKVARLVR